MMIKNIVFDFGQVMIRFDPWYMVRRYVTNEEDVALLVPVVFDRQYWNRLDAGTITDEEVVRACCERLPARLWGSVEEIYYNWVYNLPPVEGMEELVRDVKKRGFRVFLLSNISTYFADHADAHPVLELFEKQIYSAVCGMTKPNSDIFEYLCRECDIKPEETVFVDDSPANIAGAESVGITGYLFDGDAARLRAYIDTLSQ